MPNERSVFCIQYFATLLFAFRLFPDWGTFWQTLIHSDPTEALALVFILYSIVTGGWFILHALACHAAKTVSDILRWWRDPK